MRRAGDEQCPIFDSKTNAHKKEKLDAIGSASDLIPVFQKHGRNGITSDADQGDLDCVEANRPGTQSAVVSGTSIQSSSSQFRNQKTLRNKTTTVTTNTVVQATPSQQSIQSLHAALTVDIARDFPRAPKIKPGDWLDSQQEAGQTVKTYISRAISMNARPSKVRKTLYLAPLGSIEFHNKSKTKTVTVASSSSEYQQQVKTSSLPATLKGSHMRNELETLIRSSSLLSSPNAPFLLQLRLFLQAFFPGMNVTVLDYHVCKLATTRNHEYDGSHQLNAKEVLDKELPKVQMTRKLRDAYALLGATMEDLYPRDSWNFVFGLADPLSRNGVFSFARYGGTGDIEDVIVQNDNQQTPMANPLFQFYLKRARLLKRASKVMAHELSHCFGMKHCIHFSCLMQGSMSAEEGEKKPHFLCPVCLMKLYFSLEFDVVQRYQGLKYWVENVINNFAEQETETMPRPSDSTTNSKLLAKEAYHFVFGDWAAWYGRRINAIRNAMGQNDSPVLNSTTQINASSSREPGPSNNSS